MLIKVEKQKYIYFSTIMQKVCEKHVEMTLLVIRVIANLK